MENESLKKLLVVLGASLVIFWIFKPKKDGKDILSNFTGRKPKRPIIKKPFIDDNDLQNPDLKLAYEALSAYIDASNTDASDEELEAIKDEFKEQMGIVIYTDAEGLLAVKDTNGYDILVNS